jgi:VCBS repeat-containing protein
LKSAESTLDRDEDKLSYFWTQVDGESIALRASGSIETFFNLKDAPNGTFTFSVTVSDGEFISSDEVTITIKGKKEGSGSMGLWLLLSVPLLFRRRYLK